MTLNVFVVYRLHMSLTTFSLSLLFFVYWKTFHCEKFLIINFLVVYLPLHDLWQEVRNQKISNCNPKVRGALSSSWGGGDCKLLNGCWTMAKFSVYILSDCECSHTHRGCLSLCISSIGFGSHTDTGTHPNLDRHTHTHHHAHTHTHTQPITYTHTHRHTQPITHTLTDLFNFTLLIIYQLEETLWLGQFVALLTGFSVSGYCMHHPARVLSVIQVWYICNLLLFISTKGVAVEHW